MRDFFHHAGMAFAYPSTINVRQKPTPMKAPSRNNLLISIQQPCRQAMRSMPKDIGIGFAGFWTQEIRIVRVRAYQCKGIAQFDKVRIGG